MTADRPGAFVSYTDRDPDTAVALATVDQLTRAGFDVWYFQDGRKTLGTQWLPNFLKELNRRQVLVAIVSTTYLGQDYCQTEMHWAFQLKKLITPLIIEPIAEERLDEDAMVWRQVTSFSNGKDWQHVPSEHELEEFCQDLRQCDELGKLWKPLAEEQRNAPAKEPPAASPEVTLPLKEQWNRSHTKVLLALKDGAPGAKAVRGWLSENRVPTVGFNRWEADGRRYETVIRPALCRAISESR